MHYIYKYVFHGEVIYIGITNNIHGRVAQHGKEGDNIDQKYWDDINNSEIFFAEMGNSQMADVYETELIRRYNPRLNKAKKSVWSGIPLPEPIWKKYCSWNEKSEVEQMRLQIAEKENKIRKLEKLIAEKESECDHIKRRYEQKLNAIRYLDTQKIYLPGKASEIARTIEEIKNEFYSGAEGISYVSVAYSADGQINCIKRIYQEYDGLYFEFEQSGTGNARGWLCGSRREAKDMVHNVVRQWLNRGSNLYFPSWYYDKVCIQVKEATG